MSSYFSFTTNPSSNFQFLQPQIDHTTQTSARITPSAHFTKKLLPKQPYYTKNSMADVKFTSTGT
jgi:hypothetical protein